MMLHHRQASSSVRKWFCFIRKYKTDQEGLGKLAADLGLLSLLRSCFLICVQSLPYFSFLVPYILSVLSLLVLECLLGFSLKGVAEKGISHSHLEIKEVDECRVFVRDSFCLWKKYEAPQLCKL